MKPIAERIAEELSVRPAQVAAAVGLLDEGSTVPFIARYRKEATGALDDTQLRTLESASLSARAGGAAQGRSSNRSATQGKLNAGARAQILEADTKARLEDIYLPFKPKRRTKAQIASESGLAPLADALLPHPEREPLVQAAALRRSPTRRRDRARRARRRARHPGRALRRGRGSDRRACARISGRGGRIVSKVREGKEAAGAKFSDYFDFFEPLTKLPSHRMLALLRGEKEEFLDLEVVPDPNADPASKALGPFELAVARRFAIADRGRPGDRWLLETARWAWRTKIETASRGRSARCEYGPDGRGRGGQGVRRQSARPAARRAGRRAADASASIPGFRTGVKVAVVDATGKIVDTTAIYPHEPQRRWDESLAALWRLARSTRSSSSRSATARPRARPTSWPPN